MLQKLGDHIKNCLDHAAEAKRRAHETADPTEKAGHLRLERRWIGLSRSYEFAESLEHFLLNAGWTKAAVWQSRILEAHNSLTLEHAPEELGGPPTASLVRYGPYEVRLIELPHESPNGARQFWLELFDHRQKEMLDSYRSSNLEDTAAVAESLCSEAKLLNPTSD
jgi:hypothetical protein